MSLELPISTGSTKVGRTDINNNSKVILRDYIFRTLPRVKKLLRYWDVQAQLCSDPSLRRQALASLQSKAFHCQGGAVFAVPYTSKEPYLLRLIVAYQTLCDYLDNLCDRAGSTDGRAFQQLHLSLLDALTPGQTHHDYYQYYPMNEDEGYIDKLVTACQVSLQQMPHYQQIYDQAILLAEWYSHLQVKKHLDNSERERELMTWANAHLRDYPDILWQEFAAATGSTLATFFLFRLAAGEKQLINVAEQAIPAYFPWICGLHILLDYFIDRAEDREGGDLNFTFYYDSDEFMLERLKLFAREASRSAEKLPEQSFHVTVVNGLLAMYLSDRKVRQQHYQNAAAQLISTGGRPAWQTYHLCRSVRIFL